MVDALHIIEPGKRKVTHLARLFCVWGERFVPTIRIKLRDNARSNAVRVAFFVSSPLRGERIKVRDDGSSHTSPSPQPSPPKWGRGGKNA